MEGTKSKVSFFSYMHPLRYTGPPAEAGELGRRMRKQMHNLDNLFLAENWGA
jgi:hypothetical protein